MVQFTLGGPTEKSWTGRWTLGEAWEGSVDPRGGPGRVVGTSGEVQVWSGDPQGGQRRVGGPSGRSRTGRVTLGVVRDESGTFGYVRDGSRDPRGGPIRVERP